MWNLFRRLIRRDGRRHVGKVSVPSRSLLIADPQYVGSPVRIAPTMADTAHVEATCHPFRGGFHVAALSIRFQNAETPFENFEILPIDSAKALFLDEDMFRKHWCEDGFDRLGVISTARGPELREDLEKRFGLKTVQVNPVRADVVGPVSAELERQIVAYVDTLPDYAGYPFLGFRVDSDNSFDRVNEADGPWSYVRFGLDRRAKCLICTTGHGDGVYPVSVRRTDTEIAEVRIDFIGPESGEQDKPAPDFDFPPD